MARSKGILKAIGIVLGMILLAGLFLWSCISDATQRSYDQCDKAFNDYMEAPVGSPQPSILTQDWCFKHLTNQGE